MGDSRDFAGKGHSGSIPGDAQGGDFGPYRLIRRIGAGGMAETFEAIRRGPSGFSQRVCLKVVLPYLRGDEQFLRLFEREAKLAAKLRHSNIVGVIDFGQIEGTTYMALEMVDGADLEEVLYEQAENRLPHDLVALIALDLASALDHAHNPPLESGVDGVKVGTIVHRDISPGNVLISRQGEVLLTDFGLAKAVSGATRKQSAIKGKVPYMSPEQLRAEAIDGRADLFAVGVMMFEALAGRRPYEGPHDPATIVLIMDGQHPGLQDLAPEAPAELCRLVERLIEPDRAKRPASARALSELLDPFVPSPGRRRELGDMARRIHPERSAPVSEPSKLVHDPTVRRSAVKPTAPSQSASGVIEATRHESEHAAFASPSLSSPREDLALGQDEAAADADPEPAPKRRHRRARWFLWVALIAIAALVATVIAHWPGSGLLPVPTTVEEPPPPTPPPVVAPEPPTTAQPPKESVADKPPSEAKPRPKRKKPAASKPARTDLTPEQQRRLERLRQKARERSENRGNR